MAKTFGEFFKELRIKRKITLRNFCQQHEFDPGNISKLESGVFAAPQKEDKLESYAKALGIKRGSSEWIEFFDLAASSNKTISLKNIDNKALLNKLPILFRRLDNEEMTEEKLDELIKIIEKTYK